MNGLWNLASIDHVVASQFIRDNLTQLAFIFAKKPHEEQLFGASITLVLEEYIHYFTVQINSSLWIKPLPVDPNENLINEKHVAGVLMHPSQTLRIF